MVVYIYTHTHTHTYIYIYIMALTAQSRAMASSFLRLSRSNSDTSKSVGLLWASDQPVAQTSTRQHTTITTDRHPCPPVGFEPAIPASERPQIHALDRAATGTDTHTHTYRVYIYVCVTLGDAEDMVSGLMQSGHENILLWACGKRECNTSTKWTENANSRLCARISFCKHMLSQYCLRYSITTVDRTAILH